jgi:hypothetical protein
MTDWDRVGKLRTKGSSWEQIAEDERVDFHPPAGADSGRALKALAYRRKAEGRGSGRGDRERPASRRTFSAGRMSRRGWAISGGTVALLAAVLLVLVFVVPSVGPPAPSTNAGPGLAGSMTEFNYLSQQHSDACHWPGVNLGDSTANVNWINGLPDGTFLQGACCSPMDFPDYSNQTSSLRAYASISRLAPDPYNTPAAVAKADVAGINLQLTPAQQSTLSSAMPLTNDHGWCCCECWAYYAHEGLAKALIVQEGYGVQQLATAINLQDCCGGPGPMSM